MNRLFYLGAVAAASLWRPSVGVVVFLVVELAQVYSHQRLGRPTAVHRSLQAIRVAAPPSPKQGHKAVVSSYQTYGDGR